MAYFGGDYASAARAIHDTLIQACYPHPSLNYKNGAFATTIISTRPVLSCLDLLIGSPHTFNEEKAVFCNVRKFLTRYKAREAKGRANDIDFILASASMFMDSLPGVFEADQRLRGVKPCPETMTMVPPAGYKDEELDDHVKLLLYITVEAVVLACSSGFKGGIFMSTVTRSTPIIVMLGLLSREKTLTAVERAVFGNALVEAKKLLTLQIQGVKVVQPQMLMYLEHRKWFRPMLRVFEKDCEHRGVKKPDF